ncbi:MAG TPA: hypothetical protein VMR33_20850 [Candidatus Baltobacteraceae bacterium]|jgi:hypothetical protein|nr:hypothetical protein [Candidatus Baltobacteraceae bacterium]
MNNPDYQKLRETGWRRPLTPAERELLRGIVAAQPTLRTQLEEDAALNRLLGRMPAARVSSNFTARVVQAARSTAPAPAWSERLAPFRWLSRNWMPRVALGLAMVCCGAFTFREYQAVHRAQMARELASVSDLAALPPMEWMRDFDTINRLNKVAVADNDLLAALR